jgi:hypothetical protein
MAWGYRLGMLHGREGIRTRAQRKSGHEACSVSRCQDAPRYVSAYRYSRVDGRAVTVTRPLCTRHARLFSMKHTLAWPHMRRKSNGAPVSAWTALAA